MDNLRIVLWTGGDAPSREDALTFFRDEYGWSALWEPGYCGCPDCRCLIGRGKTMDGANEDYWEQWSERYE